MEKYLNIFDSDKKIIRVLRRTNNLDSIYYDVVDGAISGNMYPCEYDKIEWIIKITNRIIDDFFDENGDLVETPKLRNVVFQVVYIKYIKRLGKIHDEYCIPEQVVEYYLPKPGNMISESDNLQPSIDDLVNRYYDVEIKRDSIDMYYKGDRVVGFKTTLKPKEEISERFGEIVFWSSWIILKHRDKVLIHDVNLPREYGIFGPMGIKKQFGSYLANITKKYVQDTLILDESSSKKGMEVDQEDLNKYAVIEITKPLAFMNPKYYFQAVPYWKTKLDSIYIKKNPKDHKTISTKNNKVIDIFDSKNKKGINDLLEKLRNTQKINETRESPSKKFSNKFKRRVGDFVDWIWDTYPVRYPCDDIESFSYFMRLIHNEIEELVELGPDEGLDIEGFEEGHDYVEIFMKPDLAQHYYNTCKSWD